MNMIRPKELVNPRELLEEEERKARLEAWRQEQNTLQDERAALFALVADPNDWKAEIEAFIPWGMNIDPIAVLDAIMHFTGAGATITYENHGFKIWAVGYRAGPAGP